MTMDIVRNLLDIESLYFKLNNMATIHVMQLATIKVQVALWKLHDHGFIDSGFFCC
jgi:hypothetical protein